MRITYQVPIKPHLRRKHGWWVCGHDGYTVIGFDPTDAYNRWYCWLNGLR